MTAASGVTGEPHPNKMGVAPGVGGSQPHAWAPLNVQLWGGGASASRTARAEHPSTEHLKYSRKDVP